MNKIQRNLVQLFKNTQKQNKIQNINKLKFNYCSLALKQFQSNQFNVFKQFNNNKLSQFQFCSNSNNNSGGGIVNVEIPKEEDTQKQFFTLKSGQKIQADIGKENGSISYSLQDNIKGTRGNEQEGLYVLMYTCNVCQTKQQRSFTKQSYHSGVVIIKCEGCKKDHLIADNLGWFTDEPTNVFDYTNEKQRKFSPEEKEEISKILNQYLQNEDWKEGAENKQEQNQQEKKQDE